MRQNKLLLPTLREVPKEAEITSHKLLLRAGLARMFAAGLYTYLPLGFRVLKKIENVVRQEMDRSGAQEILASILQPAEMWQESGRWYDYGPELMRLQDRHERDFIVGPTHEEIFTTLVKQEVNSYKKLPFNLYQIQTKFRDERRPRYGMLRSREFMMKDAYSFHDTRQSLAQEYDNMYATYNRIFNRLNLNFRPVQADAGAIGGDGRNHEFMVLADIGEDTIAICTHCEYAANLEKAASGEYAAAGLQPTADAPVFEKLHTPGTKTIDELVQSLGKEASAFIKTLVYLVDGEPVAVCLRGDHDLNEIKLAKLFGAKTVEMADEGTIEHVTGAPVGFIGPVGLKNIKVVVDREAAKITSGIAGANERDYHIQNVVPGRDFPLDQVADLRNAVEGDPCPNCDGHLKFYRGIEVGHIFELGTKYSEPMGASVLDETGKQQTVIMGCYGIGISRLITAVIEQNNDENGIIWPIDVAPYHVHVIPVNVKDPEQMRIAEDLYNRLQAQGIDVLLDDRDERAGVKFKDSDLIGLPLRITVGKRSGEGIVEFTERRTGEKQELGIEQAYQEALKRVKGQ